MILIYGKGKVGSAVAALCESQGLAYDICDDDCPPASYDAYEMIIPSPGIPETHPIYATGRAICELDFAYQFLPSGYEIISVTGTDGKSTTAWMMYNILEKEYNVKKSVYLSGNFDIPFSATVIDILKKGEQEGIIVVEISSFMAFGIRSYRSDYTILTNLKPDHLNWHTSLQGYVDAKMNLIKHTTRSSCINQQVIGFAQENHLSLDLPENVEVFTQAEADMLDISATHFSGAHNAMNILSCMRVASAMGMPTDRVWKYIGEIYGLPHRLEKIGEKNGIIFVEDSKSTSSQSLEAALGSYGNTRNLLLIVGGSDKGDTFAYLVPLFVERVKAMVCIGTTKEKFIQIAKQASIPYLATDNLSDGVNWLYEQGIAGYVLMLSPGCASFGLFRDYLDRAHQFRTCIQKILD